MDIYATSFGFGQIMGFNFEKAGYNSLLDFYNAQFTLDGQIISFINFIKNISVLIKALKEKDFTKFTKNYNGDSYKDNSYDGRMKIKYEHLKNQSK